MYALCPLPSACQNGTGIHSLLQTIRPQKGSQLSEYVGPGIPHRGAHNRVPAYPGVPSRNCLPGRRCPSLGSQAIRAHQAGDQRRSKSRDHHRRPRPRNPQGEPECQKGPEGAELTMAARRHMSLYGASCSSCPRKTASLSGASGSPTCRITGPAVFSTSMRKATIVSTRCLSFVLASGRSSDEPNSLLLRPRAGSPAHGQYVSRRDSAAHRRCRAQHGWHSFVSSRLPQVLHPLSLLGGAYNSDSGSAWH